MSESIILSAQDISRTLLRMAHELIERNNGCQDLLLVGLCTRGVPLARRLAADIQRIGHAEVAVASLNFALYRDDLNSLKKQIVAQPSDMPTSVTGRRVVLVDDVLFTGRSVRAAMDAIVDWGRPKSVQLAVLVDRGHREMPIKADFVGKNIPSSLLERVQVRLQETDGRDEVVIMKSGHGTKTGGA